MSAEGLFEFICLSVAEAPPGICFMDGWMDRRIDVSYITDEWMDGWMLGWCDLLIMWFGGEEEGNYNGPVMGW